MFTLHKGKLRTICPAFALMAGIAFVMPQAALADVERTATGDYDRTYYGYDTDNDGYLEEFEFVGYSYDRVDYGNDGYINDTEWDDYRTVWYDPFEFEYDTAYDFDYYDRDNDGYINQAEYESAFDADLYNAWDVDNDGYIEYSEYVDTTNIYVDYDNNGLYDW